MSSAPVGLMGPCDGGPAAQLIPPAQERAARRPTRLAALPVIVTLILAVLAVLTEDGWLLVLAGASTGVFLAGVVLPPRVDGLVVCLLGPSRLAVGALGGYEMHVHNRGTRTSSLARVTQCIRGFPDLTVSVEPLAPGDSAVLRVERPALSRGTAGTCLVYVVSSAPLGLQRVTRTVSRTGTLIVHPVPVSPAHVSPGGRDHADRDAAPARTGLEPYGVRGWRPGDAASVLHGRSTARRGHPMVLERATAPAGATNLLLAAIADDDGWEQLLSLAAATACAQVQAGRSVTLIAYGHGGPELCSGGSTELLDWCAALGRPRLPDADTLRLAIEHAGAHGSPRAPSRSTSVAATAAVNIAATAAVPALWWEWAREIKGAGGVRLVPLLEPAR